MATEATPIDYTPLSSTKQNRIMIWRDEVAANALPDPSSDSSSLAPSSSTSTNNSSSSAESTNAPAKDPSNSRRSRFWRRLSKRLRAASLSSGPNALDLELKAREEVRTSMYRESWAAEERAREGKQQQRDEAADAREKGIRGQPEDPHGRLERAERLLNKGVMMPPPY